VTTDPSGSFQEWFVDREERERKRVINPLRLICVFCPSLLTGVAEDNGICRNREREKSGACSGYLMLSGNKSKSVKEFESYRCLFEEMEFHEKGRVLYARTGERERERERECWARSVW
jgi:hypothetical protein